jgi:hypothetical protein
MKTRCFNEKAANYPYYGGRDIYMCPEWMFDFPAFRDWALANDYKEGLSIDRIDNNEDYKPDNCIWLTKSEHYKKHFGA